MDILELLNTNSGIITAIATIFLVVATVYLGYFNQKLWIAQDKPFLIFENISTNKLVEIPMHEDDFSQNIYLKNTGKGHAFKIEFEFYHKNDKTENYSFNLLQSQSREFISTQDYLEFKISKISYEDINGIKISQTPYTTWKNKHRKVHKLKNLKNN